MNLLGQQFNRYVIERELSTNGGMAMVFLAHLVDDSKYKVAIKIARTDSNGKAHEDMLLEKELELLQRWDWRHPGIVRVFPTPLSGVKPQYTVRAVDLPDQPWYMVMEYLQGQSLTQNLKSIQDYPLEWKLELFYQILTSVAFIHSKGFAHRDLKPDNIVFRVSISPSSVPQPVLVDFALTTDGEENFDVVKNSYTLEYAAPERILDSVDNLLASDIWSLGLIFHEILTGKLLNVLKGNKDRVRTTIIRERLEPDLPDGEMYHVLASYIREMLNKDQNRRPSIDLILKALENKFLPPRIPLQ